MFRLAAARLLNHQSARNVSIATLKKSAGELAVQSKPMLRIALYELRPPLPQEIPRAIKEGIALFKSRKNLKNVTVREAFLNSLVTLEVICWFFVGEVIGKGTLIGYQV